MGWQDQDRPVIASGRQDCRRAGSRSGVCRGDELVEKIQKEGWTAFDALIARQT